MEVQEMISREIPPTFHASVDMAFIVVYFILLESLKRQRLLVRWERTLHCRWWRCFTALRVEMDDLGGY